jgi:hypothetical protein
MKGYELQQVIHMWEHEKLSIEQTIGQLLLQVEKLAERVSLLERRLEEIRKEGGPTRSL